MNIVFLFRWSLLLITLNFWLIMDFLSCVFLLLLHSSQLYNPRKRNTLAKPIKFQPRPHFFYTSLQQFNIEVDINSPLK